MNFAVVFFLSFAVILAVVTAMAVGVLFGRRAIRGSCGGLNAEGGCALCRGECPKRAARNE